MMGADTSFQIDENGYVWLEDAGDAEEQWQDDQQQGDWQMHEQWQDDQQGDDQWHDDQQWEEWQMQLALMTIR